MPPRRGDARWITLERWIWYSERVEEDERCLPAKTRRRSVSGKEVRTDRSVVRFAIVRSEGTVMGNAGVVLVLGVVWTARVVGGWEWVEDLLSPEMGFTKICIVSAISGDADREDEGDGRIMRFVIML